MSGRHHTLLVERFRLQFRTINRNGRNGLCPPFRRDHSMPSRPGVPKWLSGKRHLTIFAPLVLRLVLPASVGYSRSARELVPPVRRSSRRPAPSQSGSIAADFPLESNSGGFEGLRVVRPQANPGTGALSTQISVSPSSVNFGNVQVGSKSSQQVTITNTGTKTVTITQATVTGNGFSISGLRCPLKLLRGRHHTFEAIFAPTVTGNAAGSISIYSNSPPSPITVPLSGMGVSGVTLLLSLSPTSTNFGNVVVNTPSTLPVEIINTGTGPVTVTQANVTGTALSISGLSLPLSIPAGKNDSFNVTFDPTTTGLFNGNVSIVSNAQNSPANEPLAGTGVGASWVALSWTASTSQNIIGYNVYRGTLPNGPFTKLNPSLVPATSYQDNTVYAGDTYYYVTTAVDSQGVESVYSNEVEAIVPTLPPAHYVGLSWTASTSQNITGYNVYRSLVSKGTYTRLNTALVPATSFQDANVSPGATYYYVTTAMNSQGVESTYSNQAQATVPSP